MWSNKFLINLIWTNVFLLLLFGSTVADPLECASCDCGETGTEPTTVSSFVSQVRGEQGDQGLTGMPGAKGPRGAKGIRGPQGPPGSTGLQGRSTASAPMTSCAELKRSGFYQNGVYEIKPSTYSSAIEVYCDMEVNGGGWTLVASVHEDNINSKCITGDNWSDNQGNMGKSRKKSNSWSSIWTFGEVESVTNDDYKNSAYFNMQASDVMVWHVPNNLPSSQWSNQASLKYYTNDSFLTQYGGNLRSLYKDHFPLERQSGITSGMELTPIMEIISNSLTDIRNKIPDFFEWAYDGVKGSRQGVRKIISGGNDMFHTGNMVWVRAGNESIDWHTVVYTETYTGNPAYNVTNTANSHPFITLMFIENADGSEESFDLKVESETGADKHSGYGHFNMEEGDFTLGDYKVKYRRHNTYDAGDPSVCEVHFVIYNFETWGSEISNEDGFYTPVQWSTDGENLLNHMRVSGSPRNILLGHTLLSKADSTKPTTEQVENTLTKILQIISQFNPKQGLEPIQSMLRESSEDIKNEISGFFPYTYDGTLETVGEEITSIKNGANHGQVDMYWTGNKVWVHAGSDDWEPIVYGDTISKVTWDAANTANNHPFITLVHVKNPGGIEPYFEMKGEGRVQSAGATSTYEEELSFGDFHIKYKTLNVYESSIWSWADGGKWKTNIPSISESYFVIWNYETWGSTISQDADFFETTKWMEEVEQTWDLAMRVNGNPRNIIMGYTLLSRPNGLATTESQVKEAMMEILQQISTYDPMNGLSCSRLEESAVAAVNFHTGSAQDVTNNVPPRQKPMTTPGYLQFRAVNPNGLPFAMCPGVKTSSCRPSSVCIGGINTLEEDPGSCGDFAGYGGVPGNNPTATEADGSARSLNDLNSSILIFTRDSTSSVVV